MGRPSVHIRRGCVGAVMLTALLVLALPAMSADPPPAPIPTDAATITSSPWKVVAAGGQTGRAPNLILSGTIGQPTTGLGGTSQRLTVSGFWQDFCCLVRGDVNREQHINVSDLTFLVGYLFKQGPRPSCQEEANVDGVGPVNVADLTYLVSFLFRNGAAPPPCAP